MNVLDSRHADLTPNSVFRASFFKLLDSIKYFENKLTFSFAFSLLIVSNFIHGDLNMRESNDASISSWNINAAMWDQLNKDGSSFQQTIVNPVLEALYPPLSKEMKILEIACGNGFLAHQLAQCGAEVWAFDSSENAILLAQNRNYNGCKVHFFSADATKGKTYQMLPASFDLIVCNMAFMDIADIASVFSGAFSVLKESGCFIVTQTHPCFEKGVGPLFFETMEEDGETIHTGGVKVTHYLTPLTLRVKALPQLPKEHLFFHRPLSEVFNAAFKHGFLLEGFKENAFSQMDGIQEHHGWHHLFDIPVIAGMRFCKKTRSHNP